MENIIVPDTLWLLVKIFILLGLAIYQVFAIIIVRQEQLMANVLEESFEPILRMLVVIHLIASIGVLILAIILL